MRITTTIAQMTLRIAGATAVILGIMVWTGAFYVVLPIHVITGLLVVIALWILAIVGAFAGANRMLVALALVWGLIVPLFGVTQSSLLPGPYHWVIQVLHLAVGMVAMILGQRLATMINMAQKTDLAAA